MNCKPAQQRDVRCRPYIQLLIPLTAAAVEERFYAVACRVDKKSEWIGELVLVMGLDRRPKPTGQVLRRGVVVCKRQVAVGFSQLLVSDGKKLSCSIR